MQSSGGRSSARVRYSYRPRSEESEEANVGRPDSEDVEDSEDDVLLSNTTTAAISSAVAAAVASSKAPATSSSSTKTATGSSKLTQILDGVKDRPQLVVTAAAGLAAAGGLVLVLSALSGRGSKQAHSKGTGKAATGPGPNSKVKPTPTCVPTPDGTAVVVHRPIAADNSCLFNAVGYCMHHSTNRAPFLRQVVSREVSSDPQHYSAAFLGMENTAYCSWITNPAHWGGGIELAILASHYRREIAAWNLATGACHVFGEDAGYSKRVMVMYNGVHYDALAVSAAPKAANEEDITEFNPRTKRGKMIIAAAQKLVQLNRKGKEGHHEQQDKQKQQEKEQRKQRKQQSGRSTPQQQPSDQPQQQADSSSSASKEQRVAADSKPAAAAAAPLGAVNGSSSSSSGGVQGVQLLGCQSCGEQCAGVDVARAHAATTGHVEFAEVE